MSISKRQQLWDRLASATVVSGAMPSIEVTSPWYVRLMLGIAGWIGALFLLGFVGIGFAFVMKSASASIIVGLLCCGGVYALFRAVPNNDFVAQFGLAFSLAGQVLVGIGIYNAFENQTSAIYFSLFVVESALALIIPNFIHRVITSWAAAVALSFLLMRLEVPSLTSGLVALAVAVIWLNEIRWVSRSDILRPIGYGLTLALLQLDVTLLWGGDFMRLAAGGVASVGYTGHIGTVMVSLIFLGIVLQLLKREDVPYGSRAGVTALGIASVIVLASVPAQGVATGLLVVLLAYASGNRLLLGLGLIALGVFISHYYYEMHTTLLMKSLYLFIIGAIMLVTRLVVRQWLPAGRKTYA